MERLDGKMSWCEMTDLLDADKDPNRSEFLHWHMETTSTVWGQWNYSLSAGRKNPQDCGFDTTVLRELRKIPIL